jgi:hypothetical protein
MKTLIFKMIEITAQTGNPILAGAIINKYLIEVEGMSKDLAKEYTMNIVEIATRVVVKF